MVDTVEAPERERSEYFHGRYLAQKYKDYDGPRKYTAQNVTNVWDGGNARDGDDWIWFNRFPLDFLNISSNGCIRAHTLGRIKADVRIYPGSMITCEERLLTMTTKNGYVTKYEIDLTKDEEDEEEERD